MRGPAARRLAVGLLLTTGLTACNGGGGGANATDPSAEPTGSASPKPPPCPVTATQVPAPTGSSTDPAVKPVVAPSTTPPPTDVQVADIVNGTGMPAKAGSRVEVKYVGAFYDTGAEFDSTWKRGPNSTLPFTACQDGVIVGFGIGPIGMKVGGRRQVTIPSDFGYGPKGQGPIPGGATLVFVIDLVKVG